MTSAEMRQRNAMRAMKEYLSSHNYGKNDYPVYSLDPAWQAINNELIAADKQVEAERNSRDL